jgi:GNAT superfamily N-acetyltransferase
MMNDHHANTGIEIVEARHHDLAEVVDFVMRSRAEIFPMLDAGVMPMDLASFADTYDAGNDGCFLIARSAGELIAAIGFLRYDHRFAQLDYVGRKTVEVVRLFVVPAFRRSGLASQLFQALKAQAIEQQVEALYLHTHPFLPGAIGFWQRQGFAVVDVEDDPVWHTTHMDCSLAVAQP